MTGFLHRRGRAVAVTFLALVAGSTLLGGPAQADVNGAPTELAGYQGRAATSGLHAYYNPEGLLPVAALLDAGTPDALATISAGPSTFARASVADPGDLLVNPDAMMTLASSDYPQGTVPAYPYRVSATSGFGEPKAESTPAPGLGASVEAKPEGSTARATTPAAVAPGVFTVGSMASVATTTLDASSVTVHARTELGRLDFLDVLTVESVVTDLTATSDGTRTKLSGGTTVTGAAVLGRPVVIDADGIHADPKAPPTGPGPGALTGALAGPVDQLLDRAGIHVTLARPVQEAGGSDGQLATTGLRIDLEISKRTFPLLSQLAGAVPPVDSPPGAPTIADGLAALQAKHLVSFEAGRAQVALTARHATPIDDAASGSDVGFDSGPTDFAGVATGAGVLPAVPAGPAGPATAAVPGGPSLGKATPIASVGAGLGALALLALLVQPFLGARLATAATVVLGGDDPDICLREAR